MTRLVVTLNVKTENMAETCLYPGFVEQIMFACLILICLFVYFIVFFCLFVFFLFVCLFFFVCFLFFLFFFFVSSACLFGT